MDPIGSFIVGFIVFVALALVPLWKIFGKTGMSPWFSLLILIPGLGGLACVLILAFARWPVHAGGGR